MIKILTVEDEKPISDLIYMNLVPQNYECTQVYDGLKAADLIEENDYDLILLDIMLPGLNGYELMEYISTIGIPVIFLTAKGDIADKVKGLKLGADDYLVKPFVIVELLARVEAVLRRYNKGETRIDIADIIIDTVSRSVTRSGVQINLTLKEYKLLVLFAQNANIALFRETIFEKVWETEYLGDTRTVDLHVQRLRKKLGWEQRLKAIYKVGYRLDC